MAIPDSVEHVNVSSGEGLTLPDGTPMQGRLRFRAPLVNVVPPDDFLFGGEAEADLVNGHFSIDLVPQDATGIDPTGWSYEVVADLDNGLRWRRFMTLTKDDPEVFLADVLEPMPDDPSFDSLFLPLDGGTLTGALDLDYGRISSDVGHDLSLSISTGVMHSTGPIVQASPTSVNIPMGLAMFVDAVHMHSDPKLTTVAYGGSTVELNNTVDPLTYFMVDDTGAIVQNAGVPTRAQRREFAILGRVVVLGGAIVNVQDSPIKNEQPLATTLDILNALGDLRVSGVRAAGVPGTLTFNMGAGEIFNLGANHSVDPADPNVSLFLDQSPAEFRYVTQNGIVDTTPRTNVDPAIYDVGGVVTPVPGGANTTTIQRVHCFPTQNIFVQLGQFTYSSLEAAVSALGVGETMPFVTNPDLQGGGVRTAFIIATRTAVDLGDLSTSRIARATQFGNPGGL